MSERERQTDRRIMWRALCDAYTYSESLSDAYSHMPDEQVHDDEGKFRKGLERVAVRYFGKQIKATMDEPFKGAKMVSLQELRAQHIAEKGTDHD